MIKSRRSIRRFKSDPVPKDVVLRLLEAARWAPSWANTQCWEFIVIDDPELKKRLAETVIPENNPGKPSVVEAPIVIAVLARRGLSGFYKGQPLTKFGGWWFMFDVALAVENLVLEAHALGLGTVIIGALNHDEAAKLLGIPEDRELIALIPIGYPAESPEPKPRREIGEITYYNKFGVKYDC